MAQLKVRVVEAGVDSMELEGEEAVVRSLLETWLGRIDSLRKEALDIHNSHGGGGSTKKILTIPRPS